MIKSSFNFIEHCIKHPAFFDGFLLFSIAVLTTWDGLMASDEAVKYVNPIVRFWLLFVVGGFASGLVAVNGYRNMRYGKSQPTDAQQKVLTDSKVEQKIAGVKSETPATPITAKDVVNAILEKGKQ